MEIGIILFGIGIAGLVSWVFGDLAGTRAAQKYEEKQALKESVSALQALIRAVDLSRKVAELNGQATMEGGVVRIPVGIFESAFVSGKPIIDASENLVSAVNDYLYQAYAVNAIVDIFLGHLSGSGSQGYATKQIPNIQKESVLIPEILDELRIQLNLERETLRKQLNEL